MITSTLDQLHWYKSISPNFAKAIDYVLVTDFGAMETGKYTIDGDEIFAIVNEYTTKPAEECDPEAHQDYADIQIMVKGSERFGYMPLIDQQATVAYDGEKDVAFFAADADINYITLRPAQFIIFFPSDIHQPEVFAGQPSLVKKVVVKVAVR